MKSSCVGDAGRGYDAASRGGSSHVDCFDVDESSATGVCCSCVGISTRAFNEDEWSGIESFGLNACSGIEVC